MGPPGAPEHADALALPRSFEPAYGRGIDLGLSLGGGGLFFVAWQAGYLHALSVAGVKLAAAQRVIGTSAGSLVASALVQGRLNLLYSEVSLLSRVPALISALAPSERLRPSQERALTLFLEAVDAEPTTVRTIGHASLAAAAPSPARIRRNIALVVGSARHRSAALRITCVDAFTGERCVVGDDADVSFARAVAASSAVPGIFAPQPIGDRRCMDGGVAGSGVHLDLLAGARRVVVLALTDGSDLPEAMMTSQPDDLKKEIEALESSGTEVFLRTPEKLDLTTLMTPASVPEALAMGASQGAADARLLGRFWG